MKKIYLIAATEENFGIGKNGQIPWHFKNEMKFFRDTTTKTRDPNKQNAVIMGRTTWESLPEKFRPLPNRHNIMLTSRADLQTHGAKKFSSIQEAVEALNKNPEIESIFVIGGASVYRQTLQELNVDGIYLTKIHHHYECDTFFPETHFKNTTILNEEEENGIKISYLFLTAS